MEAAYASLAGREPSATCKVVAPLAVEVEVDPTAAGQALAGARMASEKQIARRATRTRTRTSAFSNAMLPLIAIVEDDVVAGTGHVSARWAIQEYTVSFKCVEMELRQSQRDAMTGTWIRMTGAHRSVSWSAGTIALDRERGAA